MKTPQEFLDEASDESMGDLSAEQWLEWLEALRDELDIKIAMVKGDVKKP